MRLTTTLVLSQFFFSWLSVPRRNFENSYKTPPFCFTAEFEENGSSLDVYPGRSNISRPLISFRMVQYVFEKCTKTPYRGAIGCCSNIPDLKKDTPYNLMAIISQWYHKNVNGSWFCRTDESERREEFLKKLWCCLGGEYNKIRRRANAPNISFHISLWWPIHIINSVDKTKLYWLCENIEKLSVEFSPQTFKVPMKWKIEVLKTKLIWKAFKSEQEWCFPLCHISSRSRDIQDFCIMQIRYWWRHKVWQYGSQNTK